MIAKLKSCINYYSGCRKLYSIKDSIKHTWTHYQIITLEEKLFNKRLGG